MFTVEVKETFGPFCGMGGYGTMVGLGMNKSPKKAWEQANNKRNWKGSEGGGVPVLLEVKIWKGGKLITHDIN